ncbi:hypothetical protein As57867_005699, partial [Aphanomyces stellatus]
MTTVAAFGILFTLLMLGLPLSSVDLPRQLTSADDSFSSVSVCPSWSGFDYAATAAATPCLACNIFSPNCLDDHIGFVPFPQSSIHYALYPSPPPFPDGGIDLADALLVAPDNGTGQSPLLFPRITLTTLGSTDDPATPWTNATNPMAYNWPDFEANRETLVWTQLAPALRPGRFRIQLDAWDALQSSDTCEICIAITDRFRPQSTARCPASPIEPHVVGWTSATFTALNTTLAAVQAFVDTRTNNVDCSVAPSAECTDTTDLTARDWFGCPLAPSSSTAPATCFDQPLSDCAVAHLASNPFENTTVLASPTMFLVPGNLERQCNAAYVWRESWTAFSCASTLPSLLPQCSSGLDAYRGGDATSAPVSAFGCSHNLSLAATPTDLVESITVIVNDPSAVPCAAPAATNSLCFRWGNETLIKRIQDLLAVSFTPASNAALPSNAVASVFWRWQNAALGTWHDWTANNTVVLDRASTTLVVEAWTHAGLAGTSVWTVVVLLPPTPRDLPTTTARRCLPSAPPSWHPQCTWPSVNLQIHSVHAATSSSCALPCNPFDPTTPECATACVIPKPKSTTPYTPCVGFPVQQDQRVHVTIRRT